MVMEEKKINYPLNKQEAEVFIDLTQHPGWEIFVKCMQFEAELYDKANHGLEYGPYALEKFRFNQGLAANLPRIPAAIVEAANIVLDSGNTLDSLYDQQYLLPN